jgi:hypothetical protein
MRPFVGAVLVAASCVALAAPPVEAWGMATARRPSDGWVMFYRFADRLGADIRKSEQPERVTITWRYSQSNGLPLVAERESMDKLEDVVESLTSKTAALVLVSTGNNRRQWVYYVKSAADFIEVVRKAQPESVEHPLEFESDIDPVWAYLDSFTRSVRR